MFYRLGRVIPLLILIGLAGVLPHSVSAASPSGVNAAGNELPVGAGGSTVFKVYNNYITDFLDASGATKVSIDSNAGSINLGGTPSWSLVAANEWGGALTFFGPSGNNTDTFYFQRHNNGLNNSELYLVLGDDAFSSHYAGGPGDSFIIGATDWSSGSFIQRYAFNGNGETYFNGTLDVNGEVRVGNTGVSCSASNEGTMHYDASTHKMEYCNGTSWVGTSGGHLVQTEVVCVGNSAYHCVATSSGVHDMCSLQSAGIWDGGHLYSFDLNVNKNGNGTWTLNNNARNCNGCMACYDIQ